MCRQIEADDAGRLGQQISDHVFPVAKKRNNEKSWCFTLLEGIPRRIKGAEKNINILPTLVKLQCYLNSERHQAVQFQPAPEQSHPESPYQMLLQIVQSPAFANARGLNSTGLTRSGMCF